MSEEEVGHAEYFAAYGIEIDPEDASAVVESVRRLAVIYGHPTTLFIGRVVVQAIPDDQGGDLLMGSVPAHPDLTKEEG